MIDLIPTLNATADSTQRVSSTKTYEATLSYFGRVSYDYKGKYMASASLRTDGSSRFAEDKMWGASFPGGCRQDGTCTGKVSSPLSPKW